jgi:hypothetical protein
VAHEDEPSVVGRPDGSLRDQARLADARVARHDHEASRPALTGTGIQPGGQGEALELVRAPDQGSG